MRTMNVIVDLQFGSTGKGLFAGYLALQHRPDTIITAWGPNAGHTFIGTDGVPHVNIALPNGIVAHPKRVLIGPGSVINPDILESELRRYRDMGYDFELMIHPHAAVVEERHRRIEASSMFKVGSTMKGVGAAMIQKIERNPDHLNVAIHALDDNSPLGQFVVPASDYDQAVDQAVRTQIEGAQGFSLGINSGMYPYTTSRECTVQQLLVDCGVPMGFVDDMLVYGVARTFPIRVANRFDPVTKAQVGTSGPMYYDQKEIAWADIGREPELTTVTKLPRRIFTWSDKQIRDAIRMNGVDGVFLNFANYVTPEGEAHNGALSPYMDSVRRAGSTIRWLGFGPTINDICEV